MAKSDSPSAFRYPLALLARRHGPAGYRNYRRYEPWLRDEFSFRCVYCLKREQWGHRTGEFGLDHFEPQARNTGLRTEYENLLYACHSCNLRKGVRTLPDPARVLTADTVQVDDEGILHGLTEEAATLLDLLSLNSPEYVSWRIQWIGYVRLVAKYEKDSLPRVLGYPDPLPDLSKLKPPANRRPEGVTQSHFERKRRGELPVTY